MNPQVKEYYNQVKNVLNPSKTHQTAWNVLESNPLTDEYHNTLLPDNFCIPSFATYTGASDLERHLKHYTTIMMMHSTNDIILCKCFTNTLDGNELDLFSSLAPQSIGSFTQLGNLFLQNFAGSQTQRKPRTHLLNIRQQPRERLSSFLQWFNGQTLRVYNVIEETYIEALCNGLRLGKYSEKLNMLQSHTMKELFDNVCKWIKGEDKENSKKDLQRTEDKERLRDSKPAHPKPYHRPPPRHSPHDRSPFQR